MKTLGAAIIRDMAEAIASQAILAAIAMQCIRFIIVYMAALAWFQIISIWLFFTCTYARKRITNLVTHARKFALFTKNPNSRAGLFGTCNFHIKDVKSLVRSAKRQNAI